MVSKFFFINSQKRYLVQIQEGSREKIEIELTESNSKSVRAFVIGKWKERPRGSQVPAQWHWC
jgi:hypothetical protein